MNVPADRDYSQAGILAARLGDLLGLPAEELALLRAMGGPGRPSEPLSPDAPSAAHVAQVVDAFLYLDRQPGSDPWDTLQQLREDPNLDRRLVNRLAAMLFEPAF